MNEYTQLIERFLTAYQSLDHKSMAECYHTSASFTDIAFRLNGKKQIHAMWQMICNNGIKVEIEGIKATGNIVRARIVDTYVFSDTGRTVVNKIESAFEFQDQLIIVQRDTCNALEWARQAFGGLKGEIAGRVGLLRRKAAKKKIDGFISSHPEYA